MSNVLAISTQSLFLFPKAQLEISEVATDLRPVTFCESYKPNKVESIIHVLFHFLYKFPPSKSTRMISQFK